MMAITRLYNEDPSFCTIGAYENQGLVITFGCSILAHLVPGQRYQITQEARLTFLVAPSSSGKGVRLCEHRTNRYILMHSAPLPQSIGRFGASTSKYEPVPDQPNTVLVSLTGELKPVNNTSVAHPAKPAKAQVPAVPVAARNSELPVVTTEFITRTLKCIWHIERQTPYRLRWDRGRWSFIDVIEWPPPATRQGAD